MSCNRPVYEQSTQSLTAFLSFAEGEDVEPDAFDSITYKIWSHSTPLAASKGTGGTVVVDDGVLDPDVVILDPAEEDEDGEPINFRATIPASAFPTPGHYRIELQFVDAADDPHHLVCVVEVRNLAGAV